MAIIFFGTPEFSIPSLKALLGSGEKIEAVVTRMDKVKERRSRGPLPPAVKEFALKEGLRVLQPSSMKDEAFVSGLKAIAPPPEFIVVAAFGRILTRRILDIPALGAINVHASLLPKYRGASPIAWAMINGEKETGITTMMMSEGLDEGDILLQETVKVQDDDTAGTLSERLSQAGALLLLKTLKGLREGAIAPKPQSGESSFAPPLRKEDGRVDWSKPSRDIYNFLRGMHPWPGAFCFIGGERVKLLKAKAIDGDAPAGLIKDFTGDSIVVGTGGGLISILELQPEGKKPMTARAYLSGRRLKEGMPVS